jgi:arylsulfatase A-like enzyme
LLIRWNGNIQPGAVCDRMVNIVDIFATLADVVSGKPVALPDSEDSSSFAPTLFGKEQPERKPMVTSNVAGLHALHDGKWKYIDPEYPDATPEGMRRSTKKEAESALYNLEDDPSETTNLIDKYPEVVKKMRDLLDKYRHGQGAR